MTGDVVAEVCQACREGVPDYLAPCTCPGDVGADVAAALAAEICPRASGPCSMCVTAADRTLASDWLAAREQAAKAEARQERDHCATANERAERWKARCEEERAKVARVEALADRADARADVEHRLVTTIALRAALDPEAPK